MPVWLGTAANVEDHAFAGRQELGEVVPNRSSLEVKETPAVAANCVIGEVTRW